MEKGESRAIECPYHGTITSTVLSRQCCDHCIEALGVAGEIWRRTYDNAVKGLIGTMGTDMVVRHARSHADAAFYVALRECLERDRRELPITLVDRVCFPKPLESPPQV